MASEYSQFSPNEVHDEDNCVFFAMYDYGRDQFGVTLTRGDLNRFLRRKVEKYGGKGILIPDIPYTMDSIMRPYGIAITAMLFQLGAVEHFSKQVSLRNLLFWLKVQRFLHDPRREETQHWSFPFAALLSGEHKLDHVEYVKDHSAFDRILAKVKGEKGRIPLSFKLGRK